MAGPIRIGVNALYLIPGGVGGTEIYLRNLLAALAEIDSSNQYHVFINRETAAGEPLAPKAPNFHTAICAVHATNRPARLLWEQLLLPWQAAKRRLDVLFCPGYTAPVLTRRRTVTVIHDMQHKRQPQNFGRWELLAWRASVWASAHSSREIITVSENSRRDIIEIYGVPGDRVHVVGHGIERAFFESREDRTLTGLGDWPYLLSVSTIHPHKNWERWLEAYGQLVAQGFPHHLVIAGLKGNYSEELSRLIQAKRLADRVHAVGWVPRPKLRALLRFSDALVFPSTFEGFGMPVLEALAAGVPVACSDIAPLREVAGEAALFFDPHAVQSIGAAVRRLLTEPELPKRLIEAGRKRALDCSWVRAAERTLAILERSVRR